MGKVDGTQKTEEKIEIKREPSLTSSEVLAKILDTPGVSPTPGVGKAADNKRVFLSPISKPLAEPKLKKRIFKLVKKAAKGKQLKRGVKEVVKALRKGFKGLCIIAGDIWPIDVIAHLPVMCEDRDVPYVFVHSKEELGQAARTKRPTSCLLILREAAKGGLIDSPLEEFQEAYDDVSKRMQKAQIMW